MPSFFSRLFARNFTLPTRRPKFTRLRVEQLEDRLAPAALNFLGASSDWNDVNNWQGGVLPTPADDVYCMDASHLNVANLTVNNTGVQLHSLSLASGFTLNINGDVTVSELHESGGAVSGAGTLSVNNVLDWTGGSMGGTGTTRVGSAVTASISPANDVPTLAALTAARRLLNFGDLTWTSNFSVNSAAAINNYNRLTLVNSTFTYGATTPISNYGTLTFSQGTMAFNGPLAINGSVAMSGGAFTITNAVTMQNLRLLGGTINGSGALTVPGLFQWDQGFLLGSGSLIVSPSGTFRLSGLDLPHRLGERGLLVQGSRVTDQWTNGIQLVDDNLIATSGDYFDNVGVRPAASPAKPSFDPIAASGALYRAMFGGVTGLGTDEDAIYAAMEGIRTQQDAQNLNATYTRMYPGRVLGADLISEMSGDELSRAQALLAVDWNRYVAVSIHEGMYGWYWTVQVDLMTRLLADSRTNAAQVAAKYAVEYRTAAGIDGDIYADLKNKLGAVDYTRVNAALTSDTATVDAAAIRNQVIRNENDGAWTGEDINPFVDILRNRTPEQIASIRQRYSQLYGNGVPDAMDIDMRRGASTNERDYLDALVSGDKTMIAVRRLHLAMDGWGTDEKAVWDTLNGLYADQRAMVAQVYRRTYNVSLFQEINGEFSDNFIFGMELQKTLKLYMHGGLSLAEQIYYAVYGWGTDEVAVRAALAELGNMTPAQIAQVDADYQYLSGGETLHDGLSGDLSGRDWFRAQQALLGRSDDVVVQAQRLLLERDYEVTGYSNAFNNGIQMILNDSLSNLEVSRTNLLARINECHANRTPVTEAAVRTAMAELRQHLQTFQESRDATTDLAANAMATAAGIAVVVASGGVATPLVIAIAAGAGGATQALTRMGLSGTFSWEQLPTDFALGAVNAGAAALSFPAATRAAIANGTAQIGVLRQIAGSAFVGGATASGMATALNENTWDQGFAAGVCNVAQAAAIGGFTGTVLPATIGATVFFAQRALPFVRTIITSTGTAVVNVFDGPWVRAATTAIRDGTQTIQQYLTSTLTGWAQKVDNVAARLLLWTAQEPESVTRQAVRDLVIASGWGDTRIALLTEAALDVTRTEGSNLANLTQEQVGQRITNRMQVLMMSMTDAVDSLNTRMGSVGATLTPDTARALAQRLANLQTIDDNAIRAALRDIIGSAVTVTPDMLLAAQNWIQAARTLTSAAQHIDNNLLSALANAADAHHATAVAYVTANTSRGLRISPQVVAEFLVRFSQADLDHIIATYGVRVVNNVAVTDVNALATRFQAAFQGTGRVLMDGDARIAATAVLVGEKIVTVDERFFKRCIDLGLDVEFIGTGPALTRCNTYRAVGVTIPPS